MIGEQSHSGTPWKYLVHGLVLEEEEEEEEEEAHSSWD
jgi:hypothetical protein